MNQSKAALTYIAVGTAAIIGVSFYLSSLAVDEPASYWIALAGPSLGIYLLAAYDVTRIVALPTTIGYVGSAAAWAAAPIFGKAVGNFLIGVAMVIWVATGIFISSVTFYG